MLEKVSAWYGPVVPFSRKITSSKVARDSINQRSPIGTETTGAMVGWNRVAPPVVVLTYCTPPEMIGIVDWAEVLIPLDNANKSAQTALRNIVPSKTARLGGPLSGEPPTTPACRRQKSATQTYKLQCSDAVYVFCHPEVKCGSCLCTGLELNAWFRTSYGSRTHTS